MSDGNPSPKSSSNQLPESLARELIFSNDEAVKAKFRSQHGKTIEHAVRGLAAAGAALDRFRAEVPGDLKGATLELFFHTALNAALTATHHLVSGYPIAAGNTLRHYTEAVAMALLCLDDSSGVLSRYSADRKRFPVHEAPTMLRRRDRRKALKKLIGFDEDAWEKALDLASLYNMLSHASALALAHNMLLSHESALILGAEYDEAKRDVYEKDLRRCASASESLAHLIGVVTDTLISPSGAA